MSTRIMRVANIVEEGKVGGPQVRMIMVASAISEVVDTTIIMPEDNSEDFRRRCESAGVRYKVLPLSRITREWRVALRYVLFSFSEILRLALYLKRNKFDLVHVSGGSWQVKGVIAGKLAGKKVIWHLNDTSMPAFIRRLFSVVSPLADGYIYAAERAKQYYLPYVAKGRKEFVITPPVDTDAFDPAFDYPGEEEFIASWSDAFVIGTIANVNPTKGIDVFIEAAAILNRHCRNVRFVVVGPVFKNQQRYFESLLRLCDRLSVHNIEFLGGRADVRPLLKRLDCYVCSSHAETGPMTVWEAMSMAKPVVSTDVGDLSSFIRNGYNGYIVDVRDPQGIAERVSDIVADADSRVVLCSRARETAVMQHGLDLCAKRHICAYSDVIWPLTV